MVTARLLIRFQLARLPDVWPKSTIFDYTVQQNLPEPRVTRGSTRKLSIMVDDRQ